MIITPNRRGHYPPGFPRYSTSGATAGYDISELERATDEPNIDLFKTAIQEAQSDAQDYFTRCNYARDWWYARWPYQTCDGRKWGDPEAGIEPWPWTGGSDTRLRTCERIIGQYRTLGTYAERNLKVQAESTRPAVTSKKSQQATTLINWMLFSHMQAEMHLETRLKISWRNGYGSSLLKVGWKQTRLMQYISVNVMGLQEFVNEPAVADFIGSNINIPIGENLDITDIQDMILDPFYADDLAVLLRAVSHDYLTLKEARKKLDYLREIRTVEIPVPKVFESRPQITALRPMVDVIFPVNTCDLQRAPFIDEIEMVSETELRDRIVTNGYDSKFVDAAIEQREEYSNPDWKLATAYERSTITGSTSLLNDIELHHFYSLVQDRGVPARFHTVLHMGVNDFYGKHDVAGYDHGQACVHPMRFEIEDRPILSSRGIPEIAYTWEQELKVQYDAQADRTALGLRPIILTKYDDLLKWKAQFMPGTIIPTRKFDEAQFMKPPPWDQVSIMLVQEIEKRVENHFAIFGVNVDPDLKKLRQEEFVDDILLELKPVHQQMMKLMGQLLPEEDTFAVVGLNSFKLTKDELRAGHEINATVDLRNKDAEWLKEKIPFAQAIMAMDTLGVTDKAFVIRSMWETLDYSYADMAVKDQEPANDAQIQEEQRAIDLIIGSGQDQPLIKGGNSQLLLQTLMNKVQGFQSNPATMKKIQENPEIMKVIETRAKGYQFDLQQQQNAQIGRMGVTSTFDKSAPSTAAKSPMLANY